MTASIVKVDVMADALAADQRAGRHPAATRPALDAPDDRGERQQRRHGHVGDHRRRRRASAAFDRLLGLQSTTPCPGPITATNLGWAYTTTSADDMVKVVRTFAFPNPILSDAYARLRALPDAQRQGRPGVGRPGRGAAGTVSP